MLDGKIVIVTGAGRGIGRAHARVLAAHGARVVVNDVRGAQECTAALQADGYDVRADESDISTWDGARHLVEGTIAQWGGLDGLVNNAGVQRRHDIADLVEADLDLELRVHLKGTFACTRFASQYWREQARAGFRPDASVVNTASDTIFTASPGNSGYAAAKAAIVSLTQSGSLEGTHYGVRHNAIAPSGRTPMAAESGLLPFGPDDVAVPEEQDPDAPDNPLHNSPLVVWLLSDASRGVTGQVFRLRFGSFARMEVTGNGPWITPSGRSWEPAALSAAVEQAGFPTVFPAPMRDFPDRPSEPFYQLDHS